jgi:uncharacterized protein (TIGR02001 family)
MLMRRTSFSCILCISVQGYLLSAGTALAADHWGGSVAVTTDYIYRGISQSGEQPAGQAGLQFQSASGWNAGIWGSSVDFGSNGGGSAYEVDLHAGYAWSLNPSWSAQANMVHYAYLRDDDSRYDYDELSASISFQQRVTASVAWSWNTSRRSLRGAAWERQALAYELALLQPLHPHWSLSAGVGYYDLQDLFDTGYWFWSTGITFNWQGMQVDLLHIDTDSTARRLFGPDKTRGRWTAALSWRF